MRKRNRLYGVVILALVVTAALMSGCCARLQSPIVFDSYCGGGGWGCGNSCGSYNSCCPSPCDYASQQ